MTPTRIQEIRDRLANLKDAYSVGVSTDASLRAVDAWDASNVDDVEALLTAWDIRDAALRSLVQQWRELADDLETKAKQYDQNQCSTTIAALRGEAAGIRARADQLDARLAEV